MIKLLAFSGIVLICFSFNLISGHSVGKKSYQSVNLNCDQLEGFTSQLKEQIQSKAKDVDRIIDYVTRGEGKHSTYNELAYFCDTFGPRMSGSESLDRAIRYLQNKMKEESKLKTSREKAMIPKWEVRKQWAEIVKPVRHQMSILAYGLSVGTNETIEAEVEVVNSFDQLDALGNAGQLKGKIVVYNYNFTTYGESVQFRTLGADRAAKYGALASLVRSVGSFSIYSPHTGVSTKSIPTAALTIEDADKLQRWADRKRRTTVRLFIDAQSYDDVESANLIGDIEGSEKPEEILFVSGHMDSWYDTDGAMDDGGGMMISYKALDVLSKLNMRAKRTMRAILWTSEEFGYIGAIEFFKNHKHELDKFKLVMESDLGTFTPTGLSFKNVGPIGRCIVNEFLKLTSRINATKLDANYEGSDIEVFTDVGVPGLSLANQNDRYFWFHHTSGDAITMQDPEALDKNTALWASALYVLADVDIDDFRK